MSRLRIHLFGPFKVWREEQFLAPAAWPGHKARQLLKILITHRQRAVSSDELIEWLWPNLVVASARNSLWVAVSRLRRLLEPEVTGRGISTFVLSEPPGYRFAPAARCEIDVDAFLDHFWAGQEYQRRSEWAAAIAAYQAAEVLYQGDYLAEDLYEDWAIPTRERLREIFLEVESALATGYLTQGHYREALVRCHRVLAHDACRESAWRLAMECYYRAGEQSQALRAFERCRIVLARELGVDPVPETVALHERILRGELPRQGGMESRGSPAITPSPLLLPTLPLRLPLVGRDKEWSLLTRLLQEAMGGRGRVVLVSGEPGIGKTRLLEELASLAATRGVQVLSGRCYELERNLAYAPIVEALRPALNVERATLSDLSAAQLAAMAELLPEVRRALPNLPAYHPLPPDEERLRLLAGLAQIIQCCAQSGPLVLLLDDLHWADLSTLQLLHYLGRQVHDQPLLLLGAYRSTWVDSQHPLFALQAQLTRQGMLMELALPAFSEDDVVLLLHSLGSEKQGDELARRLHRDTKGNPFFLAEVLRTFVQEGLITVDAEGRWRTAYDEVTDSYQELLLPPSVRAAVLGRLDRLPPDDRALLDLASVIERELDLPLLSQLLDQPEDVLVLQTDRLTARAFLCPSVMGAEAAPCPCYEFSHDLIRRVAYEALSEPRRRLLHRQVADALLALHTGPVEEIAGRVASHYAASDQPWRALEYALVAAEQAARLVAYDEAIAWCQQALDIAETNPMAVPPGFRTRLHLQWRTLWYYRGDLERTLAADRAALAAARREKDVAAELQALWHLAHDETQVAAAGRGDPRGCPWAQEQALTLARDLGDPAALARSLARLGSDTGFLATPQEREQALGYLEEATALARQVGDPDLLHHVLTEVWGVGRLPRARAALEEALALVRELGDRREEVGTLAKLADLVARQGDFPAAVAFARQGMALADQVDSPPYGAWNQRALGQALVALGQVTEGLGHLEEAARTFEAHAWQAMLAGTLLRLGLALSVAEGPALQTTGAWKRATEALERVLTLSQETGEPYEAAYARATLGRMRLTQGDTAAGCQALAAAAKLTACIGLPWHRGGTLTQLAAGRLLLGEAKAGLAAADEAIHLAEAEDLREVQAWGLWQRGLALLALDRADEAEAALAQGLAQAEAIGHVWLQRQLQLSGNTDRTH
jgi:DNA-binding SARP family transcriptional activator